MPKRIIPWAIKMARACAALSTAVLCAAMIALAPSMMHGQVIDASSAGAILDASAKIADSMPTDVTRLALQVAIVAIIALLLSYIAFFRLLELQHKKPCMMDRDDGRAVMDSKMQQAVNRTVEAYEDEQRRKAQK